MRLIQTLYAALFSLTFAAPALSQVGPTLRFSSTNGTACPRDSNVVTWRQPDAKTLIVNMQAAHAVGGPGIPLSQTRKNCLAVWEVIPTQGYVYEFRIRRFAGKTNLASNRIKGTFTNVLTVAGAPRVHNANLTIAGPNHAFTFTARDTPLIPANARFDQAPAELRLGCGGRTSWLTLQTTARVEGESQRISTAQAGEVEIEIISKKTCKPGETTTSPGPAPVGPRA